MGLKLCLTNVLKQHKLDDVLVPNTGLRENTQKQRVASYTRFLLELTARGTSLAVQGLKLHAPNSGKPGLIPGGGTRSYMQQLKVCMPQVLKTPHAAMKIEDQKS